MMDDSIIVIASDDEELQTESDNPSQQIDDDDDDTLVNTSLQAGLLNEAFYSLRTIYDRSGSTKEKLTCHLLVNELPLRQENTEYQGKQFGFTEGVGKKTFIIENNDPFKLATKAVIFMVVSATENWKIPVTVVFVDNPDVKYFADFVEEILQRTFENGIKIVSMTLNSESKHLGYALAKELGAEIDPFEPVEKYKAFFMHPVSSKKVHILFDIDIALDSLETFWESEGTILYNKDILGYSFISDMLKLNAEDLDVYGDNAVNDWTIMKKRVEYQPVIFDKAVADAMSYLKSLKYQDHEQSGPTIQCVRVFHLISELFQIDGGEDGMFKILSHNNETEWKPMIVKIIRYIKNLQLPPHASEESVSQFKHYITCILVTFTSVLAIYNNHGRDYGITFRPTEILPARVCLKTIVEGIFEESDRHLTALETFKLIKKAATECQQINTDVICI